MNDDIVVDCIFTPLRPMARGQRLIEEGTNGRGMPNLKLFIKTVSLCELRVLCGE